MVPDGHFLATMDRESRAEPVAVYVVSIDSGAKRKLTDPPRECAFGARFCGDETPAFSPDGTFVAFVRMLGKERHIFRVPAKGGDVVRLTSKATLAGVLSWTHDGKNLVFSDDTGFGVQGRLLEDAVLRRRA